MVVDANSNLSKGHSPFNDHETCCDGNKGWIGIDGHWYDIEKFIPHHPGGDIIREFVGRDASAVFHAFHKQSVLKYRSPCAKMNVNMNPTEQAFAKLGEHFEQAGYFETDYYWYLKKVLVLVGILFTSVTLVTKFECMLFRYLGAVALAAFWQQSGFFMHDFEHNQVTRNRHMDRNFGTFFATFCFGVSGDWWRSDHFTHHAVTNYVCHERNFYDPQQREIIWAQNEKLFPFFTSALERFCIKLQHISFLPVCIVIGRIGIMIDSMKDERNPSQLIAFALHLAWVGTLLSFLPTPKEMLIFYLLASFLQGILHIQLLISHYSKEFHYLNDTSVTDNWYRSQVVSNIDIITPWWLDWFHGGLNFHLVHHLYPRMPRHNFRKATDHVRRVCREQNLHYDSCGWFEAVSRTVKNLRVMATHFKLDPR